MIESEWLTCDVAYPPLLLVREFATVRKLRLIAAAYARWLQSLPGYEDARPCADVIEEVADDPKPFWELEDRLYVLPGGGGGWQLSKVLGPYKRVGQEVSKMVYFAEMSFLERSEGAQLPHQVMIGLLHDIFGNPFRPVHVVSAWLNWNHAVVPNLAQGIYTDRAFDRLPILADALEEAGCTNADILAHCRNGSTHVRGCWVVDLLLGKM